MSDEELIGYCALHCKTERALFHRDHVIRIFELAGQLPRGVIPEWVVLHEEAMMPLVEKARRRQRIHLVK
jgi:hypothetical protein